MEMILSAFVALVLINVVIIGFIAAATRGPTPQTPYPQRRVQSEVATQRDAA